MPFTLPPLTRRRFLAAAGVALLPGGLRPPLAFAADADPDVLALLADTHIAADRATVTRGVNMTDHLVAVGKEVVAHPRRPAAGLIIGDLALKNGQPGDYGAFADLVKPVRMAGLPLHLTLGNHDSRDRFAAALAAGGDRPAGGRIAELVPTPRANLFVLDTLDATDHVPGRVGEQQLAWLATALDAHPDKPAVVFGHHDPMFAPPPEVKEPERPKPEGTTQPGKKPEVKKPSGLLDTAALFKVLEPRRQVKAYVYGHTHVWAVKEHPSGIHLVNLPPTAYVFTPGLPSGWVHATLRAGGARLELRALDTRHPAHGQVVDLKWRA
jgi:3',5'-cyclic-AMP phosphodiesterase